MNYFGEQIPYELIQRPQFQIPWVNLVFSRTEALKFLGPKIWTLMSTEMKELESLVKFIKAIKQWKPLSVLGYYAKDIFIGLGFFNKKLF